MKCLRQLLPVLTIAVLATWPHCASAQTSDEMKDECAKLKWKLQQAAENYERFVTITEGDEDWLVLQKKTLSKFNAEYAKAKKTEDWNTKKELVWLNKRQVLLESIIHAEEKLEDDKKTRDGWADEIKTLTNQLKNCEKKAPQTQTIQENQNKPPQTQSIRATDINGDFKIDSCLVGTWRSESVKMMGRELGGADILLTIERDGTETVDYNGMKPLKGVAGETNSWSGKTTGTFVTSKGTAEVKSVKNSDLKHKLVQPDGKTTTNQLSGLGPAALGASLPDPHYTCTNATLTFSNGLHDFVYKRIK
jgi:hypothetical protein